LKHESSPNKSQEQEQDSQFLDPSSSYEQTLISLKLQMQLQQSSK
jgi:hypothetical protein